MKLDAVDTAILDQLATSARTSNREVARVLGLSEGTVRQRLKKMTEEKAMRVGLVADMATVGYLAAAILRIHTVPGQARDVATALAALEHCAFAGLVLGRFDVLAYLMAPTRQEIAHLIDTQITPLPGVLAMDVREPVGNAKHRYDFAVVA
jgi:Lrp/AsnC family transcriptional regulator for asnA, asnC and gidA